MNEENWAKGLEVFDAVYGPGTSAMVTPFKASPFNQEIVGNQFANLWGQAESQAYMNALKTRYGAKVLADKTRSNPAVAEK